MNNAAKFTLVLPAVKPGDFGPSGFAVYSDDYSTSRLIADGAVVEAVGEVRTEREYEYTCDGREEYVLAYRKVRLSDGFVGEVCWHDFNGRDGFRPVG